MTLAIDASRAAGSEKTGVGWYTHHLIEHLQRTIPEHIGVVLYSDQSLPDALHPLPPAWTERVLAWPPVIGQAHGVLPLTAYRLPLMRWPLWSQVRLAERVLHDRPDVFFVPAHVIPTMLTVVPRAHRPRLVTTVHDVVFRTFPRAYSARERRYADYGTRLAVRHADRIIVPTNVVAQELQRFYGCSASKVTVIPHGVSHATPGHESGDRKSRTSADAVRGRSAIGNRQSPYILYVGRLETKKNVVNMVRAFDIIGEQHPDCRFVIAGSRGQGYDLVEDAIGRAAFRDRIILSGWIDLPTYHALLARARVFCFPTLAEGFGMPIIEAMAAHVPVVTSRGGAHEEVADHAAEFVDPNDPMSIAKGLDRLLRDEARRDELVRLGGERVRHFSWDRTAQATWEVCSAVLSA